jgi:glycosyltransferase involved in cell wall biosynthesis
MTTSPRAASLRVLHAAETAQGGVGSYMEDIVALQAERHGPDSVRVVLPREHAGYFRRLPAGALRTFGIEGGGRILSMLKLAVHTLREVHDWRPDVVHLHSTYAGFVLRPLLMMFPSRPRIVYCAHGWAFDREGSTSNGMLAHVERLWSRMCDAIVCISRHDAESAVRVGIDPDRIVTIRNGIADVAPPPDAAVADAQQRWTADTLRVLFVGRLDRQKGVDLLYAALGRIAPGLSVVVVGSAVVAGEAGSPPANVHVVGWLPRDEIGAFYAAAQVLVVPSRWEGFGLVAVEAMRSGRGVLASRVGGLPEIVDPGVTGCLFDTGDVAALADQLAGLTAEDLVAMGEAGRARFESLFEVSRVVDELDALYRRIVSASKVTHVDDEEEIAKPLA